MVRKCRVYECPASLPKNTKHRRFHKFPDDERTFKQWVEATGYPGLKQVPKEHVLKFYFICDLHFEASSHKSLLKLKPDAVPTLNLPNFDFGFTVTKSTQTSLISKKKRRKLTKTFAFQADIYSPSSTDNPGDIPKDAYYNILKFQCKKNKVSPQIKKLIQLKTLLGRFRQNGKNLRLFALHIYFSGPLAYRIFSKPLDLPSKKMLNKINIDCGMNLNPEALKCLKWKLNNLKQSDKYCTLCAGVIPLKQSLYYQIDQDKIVGFHEIGETQTAEFATYALLIMARGIFSDWKQPLAYCCLAKNKYYKELNTWLDDVISKALDAGFNVVAFVSDQGPVFSNLAKDRNVSVQKTYFYVSKKKIYYIFDVPSLVKSVRDNLMEHDFECVNSEGERCIVMWEHICTFYTQDREKDFPLAPKLTDSHMDPDEFEKTETKLATEVLSKTVAAAMHCSVEAGQLDESVSETADFIELLSNTYNVLNSSVVNDTDKSKTAFKADQYQSELLNKFVDFLSNIIVFDENEEDVTEEVQCLTGLTITTMSIQNLYKDLQLNGFMHLLTRRLNQVALEKMFDSIRRLNGNCLEPTPVQVSRTFKKLFRTHLLRHCVKSNNTNDLEELLLKIDLSDIINVSESVQSEENATNSVILRIGTLDYRFSLPENNSISHMCDYLFKKCVERHKCVKMSQYINSFSEPCNNNDTYMGKLVPEKFGTYVRAMDDRFKCFFLYKIQNPVGNEIMKALDDISYDGCCSRFPNEYLKRIFVRFRIFHTLRYNNRLLKNTILSRRVRFCVNNL